MRIALFICIVALLAIAANYLMKILDRYMRMSKKAKTSLLIAFDNPLIIDSFTASSFIIRTEIFMKQV